MNYTTLVRHLRTAKRDATTMQRSGGSDGTLAGPVIAKIDEALRTLGQRTDANIPVAQVTARQDSEPVAAQTIGPRFNRTPPARKSDTPAALAIDEKKSAVAAEAPAPPTDEPAEVEPAAAPAPPSDEDVDHKLAAAAVSGLLSEVDESKESLTEIATATYQHNIEVYKVEGIQALTTAIGGTPAPDKTPKQQAAILRKVAKARLESIS